MALPLKPPIEPQLARSRPELPTGEQWSYEPKYDGFRCIAFVDGEQLMLQSRSGKPLGRYFPELGFPPGRYVLDGEIVIDGEGGGQDFDALQQRIHPAVSRITMLAEQTPARYVAFDLLSRDDEALLEAPFDARRATLESLLGEGQIAVTPLIRDREQAVADARIVHGQAGDPFGRLVGRLGRLQRHHPDSNICSSVPLTPNVRSVDSGTVRRTRVRYRRVAAVTVAAGAVLGIRGAVTSAATPGPRVAQHVYVKRVRTIDAVVVGYRPGKEPDTVGSLILGLYDDRGTLHVVGHSSGLRAAEKRSLPQKLAPYETGKRGHGDPSRWKNEKDLEWIELRPELVVEVTFDHTSGGRIRHGTKILRWREDKPPLECKLEQMSA